MDSATTNSKSTAAVSKSSEARRRAPLAQVPTDRKSWRSPQSKENLSKWSLVTTNAKVSTLKKMILKNQINNTLSDEKRQSTTNENQLVQNNYLPY